MFDAKLKSRLNLESDLHRVHTYCLFSSRRATFDDILVSEVFCVRESERDNLPFQVDCREGSFT